MSRSVIPRAKPHKLEVEDTPLREDSLATDLPEGMRSALQNDARHNPSYLKFEKWRGTVPYGYQANFIGARYREDYVVETRSPERFWESEYPAFDEEYFEWIDLLESVLLAEKEFVFFELGAGFGRWSVNAALAAKRLGKGYRVLAVEAEPQHFAWLKENLVLNGLDVQYCRMIEGAVAEKDGEAQFFVGNPALWYGQSLSKGEHDNFADAQGKIVPKQVVQCFSLKSLMEPYAQIDLVDMDIQGAEFSVLRPAYKELAQKVKRLHIGTHSREIEAQLRSLMSELQWCLQFDFPSSTDVNTEYGLVKFTDGVQSWINPSL